MKTYRVYIYFFLRYYLKIKFDLIIKIGVNYVRDDKERVW